MLHRLLFLTHLTIFFVAIGNKMHGQNSQPVFKNGQAQVVESFQNPADWILEEVWVETEFDSDGDQKKDRMHVMITRQHQTESGNLKLPVIYNSSPYFGLTLGAMLDPFGKRKYWNVKHELGETPKPHRGSHLKTRKKRPFFANYLDNLWVPRGYIMVYSSSPGTGLSDGAPTIGGENESLAPKAVIDWLCGRAKAFTSRTGNEESKAFWCSGKVGMTGTSYDGTLCIAAACTGVEGLEAIIPIAPVTSFYHYYRTNGLVRSPGGYLGEDMDVLYNFINTGDKSKRKRNNKEIRDNILVANQDRITGDYNAFWATRDLLPRIKNMHAALLMSHGFNDWNVMPEQSIRFYEAALRKGLPVQLYFHQGDHGGDPPLSMMNRWFTRYLHGIQNQVEQDPPVQIVREYEYDPTGYSSFPDPHSETVSLFLKTGLQNTGTLEVKSMEKPDTGVIIDNYKIPSSELHEIQYAKHRLLFLSPVLKKSIRISGTPKIQIHVASNKAAANLSVYLICLPWKKEKPVYVYENLINRAWADPQNHDSLEQGSSLVPGTYYKLAFPFMPDDQVIPKGKQIALMIFSSDKDFTLHPKPGTELYIDVQKTTITVPVVGGEQALFDAFR